MHSMPSAVCPHRTGAVLRCGCGARPRCLATASASKRGHFPCAAAAPAHSAAPAAVRTCGGRRWPWQRLRPPPAAGRVRSKQPGRAGWGLPGECGLGRGFPGLPDARGRGGAMGGAGLGPTAALLPPAAAGRCLLPRSRVAAVGLGSLPSAWSCFPPCLCRVGPAGRAFVEGRWVGAPSWPALGAGGLFPLPLGAAARLLGCVCACAAGCPQAIFSGCCGCEEGAE